jgi:hypothetical protein
MVFTARHSTGPGGRTALQAELANLGITFKNWLSSALVACAFVLLDRVTA